MKIILQGHVTETCNKMIHSFFQEIDELLSGSLTQEDEDAVLQELEEMTQVKCYTSWANKSIGQVLKQTLSQYLDDKEETSCHTHLTSAQCPLC